MQSPGLLDHLANETEYKPFPQASGVLLDYYESLLAEGLSHQQTKPLVLAKLKQDYVHTIKQPEERYREDQPLAQINYLLALYQGFVNIFHYWHRPS